MLKKDEEDNKIETVYSKKNIQFNRLMIPNMLSINNSLDTIENNIFSQKIRSNQC